MTTHFQAVMDSMDELLDGDDHQADDFDTFVQAVQHANRSDMEPRWLREGQRNAPPPNPTFSFPRRPLPSQTTQQPHPMPWRPSDHDQWRPGNPFDIKPYEQDNTGWVPHQSSDAQSPFPWNTDGYGRCAPDPPNYIDSDYSTPRYTQLHDGWVPDPPELQSPPGLIVPNDYPPGDATLTYPGLDGELVSIPGLNIEVIAERSALLATAFEKTRSGSQLNLGTLCPLTAMPLVRYLYSGSYAESDVWEDVPTSLLLHCKMYHLGNIYDLPELKTQSYVNILRQCEFGCSSPDKPIDLCSAIAFAFENLRNVSEVTESILHYCVSCFLSHVLGNDPEFRDLAYNIRPFHQDLMKVCRDRGYDDESAAAIIQMPYRSHQPVTYASIEHPAIAHFEDLIYHFHGDHDKSKEPVSPTTKLKATEPIVKAEAGPSHHIKTQGEPSPRKKVRVLDLNPLEPEFEPSSATDAQQPSSSSSKAVSGTYYGSRGNCIAGFGPSQSTTLPVRTRTPAPPTTLDDSSSASASDDDGLCIGKKRKVPSAAEVASRSLLAATESDFELLSGPESVRSVSGESGDESDTGTLVDVPRAGSAHKGPGGGFSKQAQGTRHGAGNSDAADASSESEWDLI